MPFPDYPRVIYTQNPVVEVICQLRFPPILAISAQLPAEFQGDIRDDYPEFQVGQANALPNLGQLGVAVPPEVMGLLSRGLPTGSRAYDFASADGAWKISLSQDFVALTATKYERWELFVARLEKAVAALNARYRPANYSRIGLRYKNVVKRSQIGLENVEWKELLEPRIAGVLGTPVGSTATIQSVDSLMSLGDAGQVRLRHGLGMDGAEQCYIVDADFSVEKSTETDNAEQALDALHQQSGRLFRWCISERLHGAMGPKDPK